MELENRETWNYKKIQRKVTKQNIDIRKYLWFNLGIRTYTVLGR